MVNWLHASSHELRCQLSNNARFKDGTAWAVGEQSEQLWSLTRVSRQGGLPSTKFLQFQNFSPSLLSLVGVCVFFPALLSCTSSLAPLSLLSLVFLGHLYALDPFNQIQSKEDHKGTFLGGGPCSILFCTKLLQEFLSLLTNKSNAAKVCLDCYSVAGCLRSDALHDPSASTREHRVPHGRHHCQQSDGVACSALSQGSHNEPKLPDIRSRLHDIMHKAGVVHIPY